MAGTASITLDATRRRARIRSGPAHIVIEKGRIVRFCMDSQALAHELMRANAEVIRRLAACFPDTDERQHVLNATHLVHDKAVAALNEWLMATDRYERTPPTTE